MENSAITVFLTLQCFFVTSQCQNLEKVKEIEEVIAKNTFYPPLNGSELLKPLVFGLIMSFGGNLDSSGAIPGVRVALDRINKDSTLLPGYSLHYALSDSRCLRPQAIKALFNQVPYSEPKRIALIGGGCSIASEAIAEISHHFNLMQISCVTSTPALSDRERFPNYFQFLPSNTEFATLYFGIIKEFNWRHVGILVQDENLFTATVDKLKELLKKENITYTTHLFYSGTGLASLDREAFSDPDERIYIITSYARFARQLLCEAYHRNIRYPTHMLLTYQWYGPRWWLVEDQPYTCTGKQRGQVLHMSLSLTIFTNDGNVTNTTMNMTEEEFLREESEHLNQPPFNFSRSSFPYCHDATWALAWSLNKTLGFLEQNLTNFDYMNDTATKLIVRHMNTSFNGLTGSVTFNKNGIRKANKLLVFQIKQDLKGDIETREIGMVVVENDQYRLQYLPQDNQETVWPNELIPHDGVPNVVIDTVPIPLAVIIIFLATAGIAFAIGCLIFNIMFRKRRILQISRPRLNYLIIIGAILLYITMVLFAAPVSDKDTFQALVISRVWLLPLGFTFCFGTIIMKMFRVYYIVHNPRPNKNIDDRVLMLGVLVLVIIDLILLSLDVIIRDSLGQTDAVTLVPNKDNPRTIEGELQFTTDHMIFKYSSLVHRIFIGLLYSYKLLIQLVALLLSLCTHDIKVKGLDDAKYIIAAIYITTISLLLAAMTSYALAENLSTYTAMFTLITFFSITLILGLVYIPKMVALYKDPKGERVFEEYEAPSFKVQQQHTHQQPLTDSATATIDSLKNRILELENIVAGNKQCSETGSDSTE